MPLLPDFSALLNALGATPAEWIVVDRLGRVEAGCRPVGEALHDWIPGWSPSSNDVPRRTTDERWIRMHLLAEAAEQSLYLVLERTGDVVSAEAARLAERRASQGALAAATAREMNDAMTIVQGRLELLKAFALDDPEAAARHCSIALEHAQHAVDTLHDLRLVGSVTAARVAPVDLLTVAERASESAWAHGPVQIDVHPPDLRVLGLPGPLERTLAIALSVMRRKQDAILLCGRQVGEWVRVEVRSSRRASELDGAQLGIVRALVDALGGEFTVVADGLRVDFRTALPEQPRLSCPGELLVVGHPYLADQIRLLLSDDAVTVRAEPTVFTARAALEDANVSGLVAQVLLPEGSGLELYRHAQRERPDLRLGPVLVTADPLERLPGSVRCLTGPLTRSRVVAALKA